ncbi:hypothetical protein GDO78_016145 [Eleutherodactylus coqui]|uniref:Uncharacterized protein n=1 Tax=Eleutherodactylus coqui TaxID=57060 RepID=A0A8J6C8Q8_ELECQ|nr:hypothetical protein GDO78_016145 [Eleutherodactylus coqui]
MKQFVKTLKIYSCLQISEGCHSAAGSALFLSAQGKTRSNGMKLKGRRHKLDIRKNFLTVRLINEWNRLPWEVVSFPSMEVFKQRLDKYLSGMI